MVKSRGALGWLLLVALAVFGCNGTSSVVSPTPTVPSSATPTVRVEPTATGTLASSFTPTPSDGAPTRTPTTPVGTATPTAPQGDIGPLITYFGLVRPDGCQIGCFQSSGCRCSVTPTPLFDGAGRRIFPAQGGGRGLLVVEGRPGQSGFPPGIRLETEEGDERPDLQLESDRPLGDGSAAICDIGPPPPLGTGGGVPAVDPPQFADGEAVTDALRDFACRFAVQPTSEDACSLDSLGNFAFVAPATTIQFCNQVTSVARFSTGDTVLTARLRDVLGNLGPPAQIVIRNDAATSTSSGPP